MVSVWGGLSHQLIEIERLLVLLGHDVNDLSYLHLVVVEGTLVLLGSKLVALAMLIDPLLDGELLDFPVFFDDVMPQNIASGLLEPGVGPPSQVCFNFELLSGLIEVPDEVWQLCVLE